MNKKWPPATRVAHQKFCEAEVWEQVRNASGGTGTHHGTFELSLPDGRRLRTRISHSVDCGQSMWSHILRDQLAIDEAAFWACVNDGELPERGGNPRVATESIPASAVSILLHAVGLSGSEVSALTRDEAIARVNEFWTQGS